MILPLLLLIASDPVDACANAVHDDLASAVTACVVPKQIDLAGDGLNPACESAIGWGYQAGKSGPALSSAARAGMVKEFDKRLAACKSPPPQGATPTRKITQLWD